MASAVLASLAVHSRENRKDAKQAEDALLLKDELQRELDLPRCSQKAKREQRCQAFPDHSTLHVSSENQQNMLMSDHMMPNYICLPPAMSIKNRSQEQEGEQEYLSLLLCSISWLLFFLDIGRREG